MACLPILVQQCWESLERLGCTFSALGRRRANQLGMRVVFHERRVDGSLQALTLLKPAFMSRKRVETLRRGLWKVLTWWEQGATALDVLRPWSERHEFGWRSRVFLASPVSLTVMTLSNTFEIVFRRNMMPMKTGVL